MSAICAKRPTNYLCENYEFCTHCTGRHTSDVAGTIFLFYSEFIKREKYKVAAKLHEFTCISISVHSKAMIAEHLPNPHNNTVESVRDKMKNRKKKQKPTPTTNAKLHATNSAQTFLEKKNRNKTSSCERKV